MENKSVYGEQLDRIEKSVERLRDKLEQTKMSYEHRDFEWMYKNALKLEEEFEKTTLDARCLTAFSGNPRAREARKELVREVIPIDVGFTEEGWFSVRIPALLPRKEKKSVEYLRYPLYNALWDFFAEKDRTRYNDCVLIYRHVYSRDYPDRQKRDHDNVELNMVTDAVALYVMPDDGPNICDHYYCSGVADVNRTEVYVVPKTDFFDWIEKSKNMSDKGVTLYENNPKTAKKDM